VKRMLATEECLEQHAVVARERIERGTVLPLGVEARALRASRARIAQN
jgi:hypothetical protein